MVLVMDARAVRVACTPRRLARTRLHTPSPSEPRHPRPPNHPTAPPARVWGGLHAAKAKPALVVRSFLVGDQTEPPAGKPQTDYEKRMENAGVKYDRWVDSAVQWIDKDANQFTGGGDGGDKGNGGGDEGGGGGDGGGDEDDEQRRPIYIIPWLTGWGGILHLSYVVGEWKGYGQFSPPELASGFALAWGILWTCIELFKVVPHPHVYAIGTGLTLATFVWTYRRAGDGFWDLQLTVNATYSAIMAALFGRACMARYAAIMP